MQGRNRLVALAAAGGIATLGLAVGPATHAFASPSGYCSDGQGEVIEQPLVSTPNLYVAVGVGKDGQLTFPHVVLCYATGQPNSTSPEIAGGAFVVTANPSTSSPWATVWTQSDPTAADQVNFSVGAAPTYTVTPAPAGSTGDEITVVAPITVCPSPACSSLTPGVGPTGVIVGQLTPVTEPGVGVGYQVSNVAVYVDGVLLAEYNPAAVGAYVNPLGAIEDSVNLSPGGPCVGSVCGPEAYVGTTGSSVAGVQLLGTPVSVAPPPECVHNPGSYTCP